MYRRHQTWNQYTYKQREGWSRTPTQLVAKPITSSESGELEETLGIEMASAVLGHSKVETTAIYARRKQQLAIKAARMTG